MALLVISRSADLMNVPLTERQIQVAKYAALGYTTSETARILNLSVYTVMDHRKHLIEQLHARNMVNAVSIMIEEHYVTLEELFGD